ncbi:MAG: hypothetical protein IPJ65_38090 [Archangiaceae bacterium]|nr:hypothetical protein [Archangiaceae bacterium]
MFEAQGGKCLGCERKLCFDSDTCIDHCHVSKVVRGLLCDDCNQILGRAKDSIETLNNLIGYLTKSQVP